MGGPIGWDDVPDADGDGLRTLMLGPNSQWKETMRVHVLHVDPAKRVFVFKPLNSPAGYAGTRSYARGPIKIPNTVPMTVPTTAPIENETATVDLRCSFMSFPIGRTAARAIE